MHAVVAAQDCKTRQEVLERLQAWGATAEEAQHAIDCAINDGLLVMVREDTST